MTDDDLRRAVRDHAAGGELPAGFVESVVDALPDRSPTWRPLAWLGAAAVLVLAVGVVALWAPRLPAGGPDGTEPPSGHLGGSASDSPTAVASASAAVRPSSTARAQLPFDVADDVVLSIEVTPGGELAAGEENEVIFRLTEDGRIDYIDAEFGVSESDPRVAYLRADQVDELVGWAIADGGIGDAETLYERPNRGPSGMTIITLQSDRMTKQIVYELPPGNLLEDRDPALGGLGELVRRLSRYTSEVLDGNAIGGHTAAEDAIARDVAFSDDRFRELLAFPYEVERVDPGIPVDSYFSVRIRTDAGAPWPNLATCEPGQTVGPRTGVVWQVDIAAREILAVSPVWGLHDCFSVID